VDHLEGKGGERVMAILRFQGGSPRLCRLRTAIFWLRWQDLICIDRMLDFMGPGKPSSLRTTLSNCSRPASRWFSGGRMRKPRMMAGPNNRWEPRLHPGSKAPIST
jgi:hypothetical protein